MESSFKKQLEEYKEFWGERFFFLDNYSRFIKRGNPLPSWSSSDIDDFIASDPVHGASLKTVREAANFGLTGSLIGAVSTAGVAWKYSRSLHGTALSFVAGGAFGWTFGHEVANHWLQLYRLDRTGAQVKFMEWWEKKCEGRS
ncbi:succinate dehydrogenase subunit 6, mitochondrial [Euphorbia lathyris]|uniref:succinate dehydrogenase subunit 6, mitochondrial n=1 Tax=Euphorbia lathyris TaxID=212925 RepID=UPI003313E481